MHGAGSPQAQRIMMSRMLDIEARKEMVKKIAGIKD
jgi:4-hydroxybutyryl-CoA dehydratase/vinylacetyl-CoA-Delta-isomerase